MAKMIDGLLKLIGYFYGITGSIFLFIFLYYLYVFLSNLRTINDAWNLVPFLGFFLLVSIAGFVITYSFWFLKKWGRYFGIVIHLLWLGYGLVSLARPDFQLTNSFLLAFLFLIVSPLGIICLLAHPTAKRLMTN